MDRAPLHRAGGPLDASREDGGTNVRVTANASSSTRAGPSASQNETLGQEISADHETSVDTGDAISSSTTPSTIDCSLAGHCSPRDGSPRAAAAAVASRATRAFSNNNANNAKDHHSRTGGNTSSSSAPMSLCRSVGVTSESAVVPPQAAACHVGEGDRTAGAPSTASIESGPALPPTHSGGRTANSSLRSFFSSVSSGSVPSDSTASTGAPTHVHLANKERSMLKQFLRKVPVTGSGVQVGSVGGSSSISSAGRLTRLAHPAEGSASASTETRTTPTDASSSIKSSVSLHRDPTDPAIGSEQSPSFTPSLISVVGRVRAAGFSAQICSSDSSSSLSSRLGLALPVRAGDSSPSPPFFAALGAGGRGGPRDGAMSLRSQGSSGLHSAPTNESTTATSSMTGTATDTTLYMYSVDSTPEPPPDNATRVSCPVRKHSESTGPANTPSSVSVPSLVGIYGQEPSEGRRNDATDSLGQGHNTGRSGLSGEECHETDRIPPAEPDNASPDEGSTGQAHFGTSASSATPLLTASLSSAQCSLLQSTVAANLAPSVHSISVFSAERQDSATKAVPETEMSTQMGAATTEITQAADVASDSATVDAKAALLAPDFHDEWRRVEALRGQRRETAAIAERKEVPSPSSPVLLWEPFHFSECQQGPWRAKPQTQPPTGLPRTAANTSSSVSASGADDISVSTFTSSFRL